MSILKRKAKAGKWRYTVQAKKMIKGKPIPAENPSLFIITKAWERIDLNSDINNETQDRGFK